MKTLLASILALSLTGFGAQADAGGFAATMLGLDPPAHPVSGPNVRFRQSGNPGFASNQCTMALFINGEFLKRIHVGEQVGVQVTSGQFVVQVESTKDLHPVRFSTEGGHEYQPAGCAGWAASRQVMMNSTGVINVVIDPF